jgi:hypothetical protein
MSRESKDRISASQRQRYAGMMFNKAMVAAASADDIATAYELMDTYVAEQGHTLTDEQLISLVKTMLGNLRDKDMAIRALSESGIYGRMVNSKSPVQRMSARQDLDAQHERGR